MTKKSISRLLQASLMCCLAVLFTACDDIFASEDNPIPAYLSMSDKPVTLKVGDTYRRKAISVSSAVVEYTSSKTDVATVDNEGLVTAIAEGTTTITATATGYSSQNGKKIYQPASVSYVVTVTPATVSATSLTLNKTTEVLAKNGDALTITATATPAEATLTWESSDEAVATVADGVVTPKGLGIATITAKSGDLTATCEVFVGNEVDLGTKTDDYTVQNYDILKGTLNSSYAISIPNDIKVTFNGMNTTKQITCAGNATIILADGSTNSVTGFVNNEAGIRIGGAGTTLTINAGTLGTGILNATGGRDAAGIGTEYIYGADVVGGNITINGGVINATGQGSFRGAAGIGTGGASPGYKNECGAITINGGTVTATGGYGENNSIGGAGIGTGSAGSFGSPNSTINKCGAITINGGTVTATGAQRAVGIGTGTSYTQTLSDAANNTCGAITIGTGITNVTAIKGDGAAWCIGAGPGIGSSAMTNCGTITIGGVVKAQSDFTAAIYTYEP